MVCVIVGYSGGWEVMAENDDNGFLSTYATGKCFNSLNPAPEHTTLKYCKDLSTGTLHIEIDIPERDFDLIEYDAFTRALIRDCGNSDKIADKILLLEHLVRIIEEKFEHDNKKS